MTVAVTIEVGAERYALPVSHVEEVGELGEVTPVPGAGPAVLGVRNLHGRILPVFDLGGLLGVDHDAPAQLVVAASAGVSAGLAVSGVVGVSELDTSAGSPAAEPLSRAVLTGDALVGVLDPELLFTALERHATS